MTVEIKPSQVKGQIVAPASKSYAQRALAIALLAKGSTTLQNLTYCNDTTAVEKVVESMGAKIDRSGRNVTITPTEKGDAKSFFIGESGLATRLFTPIASLYSHPITICGEGSILTRPISMMEAPLKGAGVEFNSNNGFLPIEVKGPIKGGEYEIDGSLSSQFLTGLLIAMPLASEDSILVVDDLKSKPYIDMTLQITKEFGVEITHDNYKKFYIKGGSQYSSCTYNIEGDWSGASAILVAGAIAGSVTVDNLQKNSSQADKAIIDALVSAGALVEQTENSVTVSKADLKGFEFDATDCPDLFPALAVLAAACKGKSYIKGTKRLTHKESDRAQTVKDALEGMSISVDISNEDMMIIEGGKVKGSVTIDSANDHRIAMAAATAALIADGEVTITRASAVNKSYPQFWSDLEQISSK